MNTHWKSDEELFALSRSELYTAVVGDIMDILGHKRQFLPPSIQPLRDDMVVIGRAMPVLEMDDEGGEGPGRQSAVVSRPFGLMLPALDDLKPGEVYVCSGSSPAYALWGGTYEHGRDESRSRRRRGQWLLARHERHPCPKFRLFLDGPLFAGPTPARQGRGFPLHH